MVVGKWGDWRSCRAFVFRNHPLVVQLIADVSDDAFAARHPEMAVALEFLECLSGGGIGVPEAAHHGVEPKLDVNPGRIEYSLPADGRQRGWRSKPKWAVGSEGS